MKTKLFFKKVVGFITTINNLEQFRKVLYYVLTVAHSKNSNEKTNEAITYLISKIKTFNISFNTMYDNTEHVKEKNVPLDVDDFESTT